jgi:Uncharacterized conserved protein (DUF2190)
MAYEQTLRNICVPANADLSASQFCFVVVNASGRLVLPAAGGHAEGILQDKPNAAGVYGEVGILGVSKVLVGTGGVTAGDLLASDVNGKAVTATTGNFVLGRALATGAAGTYIPALIQQKGKI